MKRRSLLKAGLVGSAAATFAAPAVVRAQETFSWRMTNAYPPGAPFYTTGPGSPDDFVKRVEEMSGGRLKIQHFGAGELIPALEGFDAVRSGTVEMNAANAYFWAGKSFAAQYFTTVPFGLNFAGQNAWLYHGGGIELWHELYNDFGLVAFPLNNTGVQMTGWFREPISSIKDFDGLKMRIPGLAGQVYAALGVNVKLLPGGEIFPALERGVIDAAEFVGPYQDRRMGLQNAAKYYYTTGWHEPQNTGELLINKAAWESLPADLQMIVKVAAQSTTLDSYAWSEAVNAEALVDLVENEGVQAQVLPAEIVGRMREATRDILEQKATEAPAVKKVHDAFVAFKAKWERWSRISESVYYSQVLTG